MTAHVHDHPIHAEQRSDPTEFQDGGLTGPARPRWLVPGVAVGLVVAALLVTGVVSLSTVLYFGLFGGMILMHVGGHGGHGGHAGAGGQGTPAGQRGGTTPEADDLSARSHHSQLARPVFDEAPEDSASIEPNGSETQDHDQHHAHGCH